MKMVLRDVKKLETISNDLVKIFPDASISKQTKKHEYDKTERV